ncbi:MAG: hypothetical protein DSO07_12500 [Thermoproteota archaeon]|uniref:Tubulin/FtsZ GTPase domain-containing protein n=1 Tax=Candidatus Methanodesulfokora washburnensis TaxID=2478471 RepID=A0A520KPL0_9CREN|nr:MAG: hypothetical protein EF810_01060 [Candidatus Methanodesulfokores washburnensis]TDA37529.1 MAG: hypothetical protein DSO07_12500 [Candidatus Korarchaeota archaeon]
MQVLMIGLGLGGTAVADRVLTEMEHAFANAMVYEIYRACIEGVEEDAKCYVGVKEKKVWHAERIAVEALRPEVIVEKEEDKKSLAGLPRPYVAETEKKLDEDYKKMKKLIKEEKGLEKEEKDDLIAFLEIVHERRKRGSLFMKGRKNRFVEALEDIVKRRKYIDVLLMNTSRQDKATIMENQKTKVRVGTNILGNPVELSRFDEIRVKDEDYIIFGEQITHGGGAGWDNVTGMKMAALEEDYFRKIIGDRLSTKSLEERAALIVAVVFGSGGGTGSGAAPVVCKAVKDLRREDVRTIAFALLPAKEECRMRAYNSVTSLAFTNEMVTGVGLIPLEDYVKPNLPLREAYDIADENLARFFVLMAGAEELTDIKNDVKNELIKIFGGR